MMPGPTLGNAPQLDNQQLFDSLQVNIAEMAEDKRLKGLMNSFADLNTLSFLAGDINDFADAVRAGTLSKEQQLAQLKTIAEKALRALGRTTDQALEQRGTNYKGASRAVVEHLYKMARYFGLQLELSSHLDNWGRNNPHTEDPKEQTFQEQKEAAFQAVTRRFPEMIEAVTKEKGFGPTKVVDGCISYMLDVMAGQGGAISYYFGIADKFQLSPAEQEKRTALMKEKLRPMVEEALRKNARRGTKTIFEPLTQELFPTAAHVRGKTAGMVADEMIVTVISKRCKKRDAYPEYRHLAYYWPEDPKDYSEVNELRQNLIHLTQAHWGPALATDKHSSAQIEKAKTRIGADPAYFDGYTAPVEAVSNPGETAPAAPEAPAANGSAPAPAPKLPEGEGTKIHDIAAMQAELAARAAAGNGTKLHPVPKAAQPAQVHAEKSVIINGPHTVLGSGDKHTRPTIPEGQVHASQVQYAPTEPAPQPAPVAVEGMTPANIRPQRPDIQIAQPDPEATKTSEHRKAERKKNGFVKWAKRAVFAAAAALGITAGYGLYKANQASETQSSSVSSTDVAPTVTPSAGPSAVAAVPTATPSAGPSVAVNTPAPTASATAPNVTAPAPVAPQPQPVAGKPAPAPETLAAITDADLKQIVEGEKTIKGPYSTDISAPFYRAAHKIADPAKRADALKQIGELHQKINRGAYASYMKRFARLTPSEVQAIVTDKTHPEHNLLTYLMREDKTAMGMGPNVSAWNSKVPAVDASGAPVYENGKLKYVNYEERFAEEMKLYEENFEGDFKAFGLDKRAPGNIHMGAWAGDKVSTFKDGKYLWYVQELAKITGVELPSAPASADPQQGGGNAQPKGKSGFNMQQNDIQVPGNIPTNILPGSKYGFVAPTGTDTAVDSLDAEIKAFNKSAFARAAEQKRLYDQKLAQEVTAHVQAEDQKLVDFETRRRSRSFFTKLSDTCQYIWSGATPEECAQGMNGMGGIRGLFMTKAQRQAELLKRTDAMMAQRVKPAVAPVVDVNIPEDPQKVAADLLRMRDEVLAADKAEREAKAEEERQAVARINQLRDQIMAADAAEKAEKERIAREERGARKVALRKELDAKMERLFAKGKAMAAERGPAPVIDFRKEYKVAAADKSIKFVLERQIALSDLSDEAKQKSLAAVQDMIRSNGAFIESYKMHQDGSRDLVIKDEWRTKLNEAAGVQVAVAPAKKDEEVLEGIAIAA